MGFSMSVLGSAMAAGGASADAKAKKSAYKAQAQADLNNAQLAEWQAQQAEAAGRDQERSVRLQTQQTIGGQRAAMAANGVDLGEGSATEVLASTKFIGEHDALAVRDNATRAAWASRVRAQQSRDNASASLNAADNVNPTWAAASSLLSNAGAVSSSWKVGAKTDPNAWYVKEGKAAASAATSWFN